jgi:hypothetical protein
MIAELERLASATARDNPCPILADAEETRAEELGA